MAWKFHNDKQTYINEAHTENINLLKIGENRYKQIKQAHPLFRFTCITHLPHSFKYYHIFQ